MNSIPIRMFTDGACKGNPGKGGWGVVLEWGEHRRELCGGELETTNNRMELRAAIEGLKALKRPSTVIIITDSSYVKDGITKWIKNWKKNGWKTSSKKSVANNDLWKILDDLVRIHEVSWIWVRGHTGDAGNERADELANRGVLKCDKSF